VNKILKNLSQDNQCLGQHSNEAALEYYHNAKLLGLIFMMALLADETI
jgi:hypothetical protein